MELSILSGVLGHRCRVAGRATAFYLSPRGGSLWTRMGSMPKESWASTVNDLDSWEVVVRGTFA